MRATAATRPPKTEAARAAKRPGATLPAPEEPLLDELDEEPEEVAAALAPLPELDLEVARDDDADELLEDEVTRLAIPLEIDLVVEQLDELGMEYAAVGVAWSGEPLTKVWSPPLGSV